jgi:Ca2+-binding EF-hand superfamily protein
MSDPETVKLKKEIHHLKEMVAELQNELEEKNMKYGQMEREYNQMKNETYLITKNKLMNTNELLKQNVEKALEGERFRMQQIEKSNEDMKTKMKYMDIEKHNLENNLKELQQQNNKLRKHLDELGQKHQVDDILNDVFINQDAFNKKDKDYQKLILEWNALCDKMEDVLSENRVLREMAGVDDDFGFDITSIKIGERAKIEDYKKKIKMLEREVDELIDERNLFKNKLKFMKDGFNLNEEPFSLLKPDEQQAVREYAWALYNKSEFIIPERYELYKENQVLHYKIDFLEKQLHNLQLDSSYRMGMTNNLGISRNKKEDNAKSEHEAIYKLEFLTKENEELKTLFKNVLEKLPHGQADYRPREDEKDDGKVGFNSVQLPPIPLIDHNNIDNPNYGYSYRFNNKFRIDPAQIHQLYGIAKSDTDIDAFKIESASLQTQLIEILEVVERMKTQDQFINDNISKLYDKLESIMLMQNELFEKFVNQRKSNKVENDSLKKNNKVLLDELNDIQRKDKALEDTLRLLETKNPTAMEMKAIEKLRENAVLEMNYLKLTRKYEAIVEDERKLRSFVDEVEKNNSEKDKHVEFTIIKLREWKQVLTFYLKFLTKKLKESVSKVEFEKVLEENKYLREKQHEIIFRDLSFTKKMSLLQNIQIKLREVEQNFFRSEELRIDSEIELNYTKKRLQEADPSFALQESVFRKFITQLNNTKLPFVEIRRIFDQNSDHMVTKDEFMRALYSLDIDLNEKDKEVLLGGLDMDIDGKIDIFYFLRKLERSGVEEEKEEEVIMKHFIDCLNNSNLSLRQIFEMIDTDGSGTISKEEFKFTLSHQIKIDSNVLDKIIFMLCAEVEGDEINYNQFCEIFDSKTKHMNLKNKKNNQIRKTLKIDWMTNVLASIIEAAKKIYSSSYLDVFKALDYGKQGKINKEDFVKFLKSINNNFTIPDMEKLFNMIDKDGSGSIDSEEFVLALKECENKILRFKAMTAKDYDFAGANIKPEDKFKHKAALLEETEKYHNFKMLQMKKRLEEVEKALKETTEQLEKYSSKHLEVTEKYFQASEELSKIKGIYDPSVTKDDFRRLNDENDNLSREITVLRVGLVTFKDLYNSSNKQNQQLMLKVTRNDDELDTFKKAIKDLQGESNPQALIGKLYYSLLVSRWREALTVQKYDDFLNDLATMKEHNFNLETENKVLVKEVTEMQTIVHDKIIENIRLEDALQNYTRPFVTLEQLEELKLIIKELSTEKTDLTEKYLEMRKSNLKIANENEELKNRIEFAETLGNKIRYSNKDECSKKLIEMAEELSKLKLKESILSRENIFLKEGENYLNKLIDHFNKSIKGLEVNNAEWEVKFRKAEENWRSRDEERQKNFFNQVKSLNLKDMKFIGGENFNNLSDIKDKSFVVYKRENENLVAKVNEYEAKLKQLEDMMRIKNGEIKKYEAYLNENNEYMQRFPREPLLNNNNYELLAKDETRQLAETAHKTIKTLQELISTKNSQLGRKDETIETLKDDILRLKEEHLREVARLQELVDMDHEGTMKKLKNVLDNVNQHMLVKISKNQLSTMTLHDLEDLIEEKDNTIKQLAFELQKVKEENEINYLKIIDLNKRINELNLDLNDEKYGSDKRAHSNEIERLRRIIKEKSDLIEEEKERIKKIREEFTKRLEDRKFLEEQMFNNTAHVPDRLIDEDKKNQLYNKLNKEQSKTKKLKTEIEKLNKQIEEYKTKSEENAKKLNSLREENKAFLTTQSKDTSVISRLKKEKEELKEGNNKLKEEKEHLKKQITNLTNVQSNNMLPPNTTATVVKRKDSFAKAKPVPQSSVDMDKREFGLSSLLNITSAIQKQEYIDKSVNIMPVGTSETDQIKNFTTLCLKKNIHIGRHLQRYDITKIGKINRNDFIRAIDELKLGYIDNDINKLLDLAKLNDTYISIQGFLDSMIRSEPLYENVLKQGGKL